MRGLWGSPNWGLVLGLTGNLGSGKSTVLKLFQQKGAFVLDSDRIVHQILDNDHAMRKRIVRRFGKLVLRNKGLDKAELSKVVFSSSKNRKSLEAMLHPQVKSIMAGCLRANAGRVAVCDVPLLFEVRWQKYFDKTMVVTASEKVRFQRLLSRGMKPSDIRSRQKAQWPLNKKIRKADFVVFNGGSKKDLKIQVHRIWKKLIDHI